MDGWTESSLTVPGSSRQKSTFSPFSMVNAPCALPMRTWHCEARWMENFIGMLAKKHTTETQKLLTCKRKVKAVQQKKNAEQENVLIEVSDSLNYAVCLCSLWMDVWFLGEGERRRRRMDGVMGG